MMILFKILISFVIYLLFFKKNYVVVYDAFDGSDTRLRSMPTTYMVAAWRASFVYAITENPKVVRLQK